MNYEWWFPSIIGYDKLDIDNETLGNYCLKCEENSVEGRLFSNIGGWQSSDLDHSIPELKPLIDGITITYRQYMEDQGAVVPLRLDNLWININRKGNSNGFHVHPGCILSGCYYVKAPKDCGSIVFEAPNSHVCALTWDTELFANNKYLSRTCYYTPEDGQILVFPSWLRHSVNASNTDETRISIAFNVVR